MSQAQTAPSAPTTRLRVTALDKLQEVWDSFSDCSTRYFTVGDGRTRYNTFSFGPNGNWFYCWWTYPDGSRSSSCAFKLKLTAVVRGEIRTKKQ